tara:strand:+ start:424 stop:618 length:195 start_codon:yes stop_codon:yes gene_type:complete
MNQAAFVASVYEVAWKYNKNLDEASSFQEVIDTLMQMQWKARQMNYLKSAFTETDIPTHNDCDI